jgi:hypothetical protein
MNARIQTAIEILKNGGAIPFADGRYALILKPEEVAEMTVGVQLDDTVAQPALPPMMQQMAGTYLGACDLAYVWEWRQL